jgi:hypothetical protein
LVISTENRASMVGSSSGDDRICSATKNWSASGGSTDVMPGICAGRLLMTAPEGG